MNGNLKTDLSVYASITTKKVLAVSNPTDPRFNINLSDAMFSISLDSWSSSIKYQISSVEVGQESGFVQFRQTLPSNILSTYEGRPQSYFTQLWLSDDNAMYLAGFPEIGNQEVPNFVGQHVEGCSTRGIGRHVHVEGRDSIADVRYSHAEGSHTIAGDMASHAEGFRTFAKGRYSHAEGSDTVCESNYGHSEGYDTTAGYVSHAEGWSSKALGQASHAEGKGSNAFGNGSHAEGLSTSAYGSSSHAEG